MKTVRIAAPVSDDNPQGFVVINVSDFDPALHEPHSQEDFDALRGADLAELNPAIVAGAGAQMDARAAELQAEAARQREQADILKAEGERLAKLSADLEAKAAALAAQDAQDMTAAEMREQLTAKGIKFKAADNKAELQALLDAAPK